MPVPRPAPDTAAPARARRRADAPTAIPRPAR